MARGDGYGAPRRSRSGSLDSMGRRKRRGGFSGRRGRRSASRSRSRSRSPSRSRRRTRGRRRSFSPSRSRSRSRSPERARRSRSRSRERRRSYSRSLSHSRSRPSGSQRRDADSSRAETPASVDKRMQSATETSDAAAPDAMRSLAHLSEEEQMKLLMGFGDFDSTKGKAVDENIKGAAVGTARRETKREYRQYMNRRGGFNRPLDKA